MMQLDARQTLGKLCAPDEEYRAEQLVRELTQLTRDRHVTQTPLIFVRLEEFLVLYYVVHEIEAVLREEGVYMKDDTVEPAARRLHPNLEHAAKARERLNKSIKELDAVLKSEGSTGPASISELLASLKDEHEREDAIHAEA
jgi:hypothetical protein